MKFLKNIAYFQSTSETPVRQAGKSSNEPRKKGRKLVDDDQKATTSQSQPAEKPGVFLSYMYLMLLSDMSVRVCCSEINLILFFLDLAEAFKLLTENLKAAAQRKGPPVLTSFTWARGKHEKLTGILNSRQNLESSIFRAESPDLKNCILIRCDLGSQREI